MIVDIDVERMEFTRIRPVGIDTVFCVDSNDQVVEVLQVMELEEETLGMLDYAFEHGGQEAVEYLLEMRRFYMMLEDLDDEARNYLARQLGYQGGSVCSGCS